jgi:hypothetical protein
MSTNQEWIEEMRQNGKYEYVAWPGCYPLYYITADGGVLCPKCANDNFDLTLDKDDPQWYIVDIGVNWEDEELICDNCYKKIESAYGDD